MSCKHANNSDLNVEMRITLPCIDTLCKRSLVTSVCDQKLRKMPGLLRRIYYVTWGADTNARSHFLAVDADADAEGRGSGECSKTWERALTWHFFPLWEGHEEVRERAEAPGATALEYHVSEKEKKYSRVLHTCRARAVYWHPNNSGHEVNALENLPVMTLACWTLATLEQASRSSC